MSPGLLYPDLPALVTWDEDRDLEIVDFARGWIARASGVFGAEAVALLERGEAGHRIDALNLDHPIREALAGLDGRARLPLSPASALRLDRFDTLFIELTGACTSRCVHCYARAEAGVESRLDRRTCEAIIDEAPSMGFRWIQLTGGEPLLCDFIASLVQRVARLEGTVCEIYTNGTLLSDARLDELATHRPSFAFSFYSHRREIHEAITRTPGSHDLTIQAIGRTLSRGLPTRVSIVVMPENADHVDQTIAYLQALGVESISYGRSYAVGRGSLFSGAIHAPVRYERDGDHRGFHGKLCVSYDGSVFPCIFNRTSLGRVPERRLSEIAASPRLPAVDQRTREEVLKECKEKLACVECQMTAYTLWALQSQRG